MLNLYNFQFRVSYNKQFPMQRPGYRSIVNQNVQADQMMRIASYSKTTYYCIQLIATLKLQCAILRSVYEKKNNNNKTLYRKALKAICHQSLKCLQNYIIHKWNPNKNERKIEKIEAAATAAVRVSGMCAIFIEMQAHILWWAVARWFSYPRISWLIFALYVESSWWIKEWSEATWQKHS